MDPYLARLIDAAFQEDVGPGDITTDAIVAEDGASRAEVTAKQDLVLAGGPVAAEVFRRLDASVQVELRVREGDRAPRGSIIAEISGRTRALLTGERLALNLLQHLSGIATLTARYVDQLAGLNAAVLDTRKTLPGLRALEKYAVRIGGGKNHRFALYDGILIKDNHIAVAGGIRPAVEKVRRHAHPLLKIEVEVRNLEEVQEALAAGADIIMLDNMPPETMREAVRTIAGRAVVEASGNVTLGNVRAIAETGVDLISAGSLTHSAPAADISMKIR